MRSILGCQVTATSWSRVAAKLMTRVPRSGGTVARGSRVAAKQCSKVTLGQPRGYSLHSLQLSQANSTAYYYYYEGPWILDQPTARAYRYYYHITE